MYFEDVDFCRTAFDHGWKIAHVPEAEVIHLRGGSSSTKTDIKARRRPPQYVYESRSRYFKKFYGPLGVLLANLCWLLGRGISYLRESIGSKSPHICLGQGRDIWIGWCANPPITQPANLQKSN